MAISASPTSASGPSAPPPAASPLSASPSSASPSTVSLTATSPPSAFQHAFLPIPLKEKVVSEIAHRHVEYINSIYRPSYQEAVEVTGLCTGFKSDDGGWCGLSKEVTRDSTDNTSFHQFRGFPTEVKSMIWKIHAETFITAAPRLIDVSLADTQFMSYAGTKLLPLVHISQKVNKDILGVIGFALLRLKIKKTNNDETATIEEYEKNEGVLRRVLLHRETSIPFIMPPPTDLPNEVFTRYMSDFFKQLSKNDLSTIALPEPQYMLDDYAKIPGHDDLGLIILAIWDCPSVMPDYETADIRGFCLVRAQPMDSAPYLHHRCSSWLRMCCARQRTEEAKEGPYKAHMTVHWVREPEPEAPEQQIEEVQ